MVPIIFDCVVIVCWFNVFWVCVCLLIVFVGLIASWDLNCALNVSCIGCLLAGLILGV